MKLQLSHPSSSTTSLLRDSRGLSTVEYIILLVLLAVGCITAWGNFRDTVIAKVGEADSNINGLK